MVIYVVEELEVGWICLRNYVVVSWICFLLFFIIILKFMSINVLLRCFEYSNLLKIIVVCIIILWVWKIISIYYLKCF